ncbi:acyltransferase [Paenibacillus sepulcri]|uniref:Acyltransferase n=1 Tax=Paenibacillus sepulcri TaxID=359917 RepID=A0ABS7C1S9_9BACL|nr:acyltransferase [Paenibacillus sepulcri]
MVREKLTYLEILRGFAILAVLAIHTTSSAITELSTASSLFPVYKIINAASHFAVPAFLFLSSLLLFYHYDESTKQNWLVFYRKRLKTIVIPYLIWSVFYSAADSYVKHMSAEDSLLGFVKGLPFGGSYPHLYFIIVIAQFYLAFPLFHLLFRIRFVKNHPLLCGAAAQTAFYLLNYYALDMKGVGSFIGSYLLYLFLGAYAAGKLKTITAGGKDWRRWCLFAGFIISAVIYVGQMWLQKTNPHWIPQPYYSYLNFVSDYSYAAISCIILLQAASLLEGGRLLLSRNTLLSIGTYSFGIYFIHPFFLLLWRQEVMVHGAISYHLLIWAGGAVAFILSWLITIAVQKSRLGVYIVGKSDSRRLSPASSTT